MGKNYYTTSKTSVRDTIISKAHLLSPKLIFDPETQHGGFVISFIVNSSEELLKNISSEADKMHTELVELWFFEENPSTKITSKIPDGDLKNYLHSNAKSIIGSISPYVDHADDPPRYHVNVIF